MTDPVVPSKVYVDLFYLSELKHDNPKATNSNMYSSDPRPAAVMHASRINLISPYRELN